jgi:hypothetical protein
MNSEMRNMRFYKILKLNKIRSFLISNPRLQLSQINFQRITVKEPK